LWEHSSVVVAISTDTGEPPESVTATNTPPDQLDKKEARKEGAAFNGNWGYAPGNGVDPNDEWGRSSGVLDTTSPGCPFEFS
jgi:hypothetical protein